MKTSERSISVWKATHDTLDFAPLSGDARVDVCVIGAGIAGMSVAYELAVAGRSVLVLDDNAVGGGETGQTTAHLSSALDDRYYNLERIHGEKGARLAYQSHDAAITRIEAICRDERIDCDFERVDGYLFLAPHDRAETLEREREAARRAGFVDVELVDSVLDFASGPALRFPRLAQFHPLRYLAGLASAIQTRGGRIHTGTRALEVAGGKVTTTGGTVLADHVVVATNTPFVDRLKIHSKQAPYRSYVITLRVEQSPVLRALYWDTGDPYHYVRTQRGEGGRDYLIVGGEDHKTGASDDAEERWRRLEEWARSRLLAKGPVVHRWSGQVYEPYDGVAYIGRNPGEDRVYVATGDSGHGITHGVIAGMLISDQILGNANAWEALYDPSRKSLRGIGEYAKINLDVARHLADWVKPGDARSLAEVAPGTGAVVGWGPRKVAAYRDETGALTVCSATCPHLGCVVHFNSAEKSWDCPCHGSRFSIRGEVLNGPAASPLEVLSVDESGAEPPHQR